MLNPALETGGQQPLRVGLEQFLLERRGVGCTVRVAGLPELASSSGRLFLTTLRIVFVAGKRVALGEGAFFESFDVPLASLSEERFNQPIFGANNLTGIVQPVPGMGLPGPARFTLTFREGGCGTFLHFFIRSLREVRTAPGDRRLAAAAAAGLLRAESAAFLDPNDPTTVYLAQPTIPASAVPVEAYVADSSASSSSAPLPRDDRRGAATVL